MKQKRPNKRPDLLAEVRDRINEDRFITTVHAQNRQSERFISLQQIRYVLLHGSHEKVKDAFDEAFRAWNYAIRGNTFDDVNLRVIVSFNEKDDLLIITAFEVAKEKNR